MAFWCNTGYKIVRDDSIDEKHGVAVFISSRRRTQILLRLCTTLPNNMQIIMCSPQMFIQSIDTLRIKITDTVFEMLITYKHKP